MAVALVFPGQGSQRLGMLDALTGRPGFIRLLDAAEALSGLDLRAVASQGTDAQLADTRAAQPLLYLADWAWGAAALAAGIRPAAVAGHSLGELAALAIAGVYSVEAGLELVVERSRLMAECAAASPGTMAAVLGMDSDAIRVATASIDGVWVANDNSPGQVVVSGTVAGVTAAQDALLAAGARRVIPLPVAGGFHTPLMRPAADAFRDILESTSFADASVPVYSNTAPHASVDAGALRERLATQMVSPVRWTETIAALRADGVATLLEAGPGAVLTGLAKRTD
ncbi:MAG TPA: ACP S-malonyltransferase, partial [Coriobacteriia bacterium]